MKNKLRKFHEEAQHFLHTPSAPKLAIVIDGKCLMYALEPSLRVMLLNLALNCCSVICCRVSPLQKAQVRVPCRDSLDIYNFQVFFLLGKNMYLTLFVLAP